MFDIKYNKDTFINKNVLDDDHSLGAFIMHQQYLDDLAGPKVRDDPLHFMFEWDHDLRTLNGNAFPALVQQYKDALDSYIDGEWRFATQMLVNCLTISPEDGPSKELFRYIQSMKEVCPEEWLGYRDYDYLLKPEDVIDEEAL